MLVKTLKSETVYEIAFDLVGVCLRQILCIKDSSLFVVRSNFVCDKNVHFGFQY